MRPIILFVLLCLSKEQNPVATLNGKGSFCAGSDTLFVSSSETPWGITWYNGPAVVATATATLIPYGVTVAGSNVTGPAASHLR